MATVSAARGNAVHRSSSSRSVALRSSSPESRAASARSSSRSASAASESRSDSAAPLAIGVSPFADSAEAGRAFMAFVPSGREEAETLHQLPQVPARARARVGEDIMQQRERAVELRERGRDVARLEEVGGPRGQAEGGQG
ncbi:hypothetical protein LTR53_017986 [Teratosphaeriaceae sp. CCFEE 6253]|nr:hypothetical protein LTR53_017986 [Teratosphaeriaceae sp. CCFEE 6253]